MLLDINKICDIIIHLTWQQTTVFGIYFCLHFFYVDEPKQHEWGTFEIAALIAAPIILLCIVTVGFFYYTQNKRNMHHHVGLCEDSIEAPDHPILKGVSLRHMIEMTTSGSGSGMYCMTPSDSYYSTEKQFA